MSRVYFHIDLNAFFANAEILLNTDLKGKPIAVAGKSKRSVISTCSYEARAYGVHSAEPLNEALSLCPKLIVCEPHFSWYSELSNQFMNIIKSYTSEIEQASIDECYADMTDVIVNYQKPLDLAFEIQRRILKEVKLPCSIGIGPNMFLAKMASDYKKPMGITVFRIREVEEKLWPLPIGDMRGVGNKTVPYLLDLGINTIGDLANYKDIEALRPIFGKNTENMIDKAHGHDDRKIVKEYDSKSMGISETLEDDISDYDELRGLIRSLSRRLSNRLKEDHKYGYSLSIRMRYSDFRNNNRSITLEKPIYKSDDIFVQAIALFDESWTEEPVRLLGISLSDFKEINESEQISIFDKVDNDMNINSLLKELNHTIGKNKLILASEIKKEME